MGLLDNNEKLAELTELDELFDKDNKVEKVHMKIEPDKEEMKIDIFPQKPDINFDEFKIDNRLNSVPIASGDKMIEVAKDYEGYATVLNLLKENFNLSKDEILNIDILFDTIGPAVSKFNQQSVEPIGVRNLRNFFTENFVAARETLAESKYFDDDFAKLVSNKLENFPGMNLYKHHDSQLFQEFINDAREGIRDRICTPMLDIIKLMTANDDFSPQAIEFVELTQGRLSKFNPKTPEQELLFLDITQSILDYANRFRTLLEKNSTN